MSVLSNVGKNGLTLRVLGQWFQMLIILQLYLQILSDKCQILVKPVDANIRPGNRKLRKNSADNKRYILRKLNLKFQNCQFKISCK